LQQCNAGGTAWSAGTDCPILCDATGGECDECTGMGYSCAGTALQQCGPTGHWALVQDCALTSTVCNPIGTCDPP
jgi:hypothetical protein